MELDKDYSQMLCQAVDYLIDAKLENISYDITILCTVEDDSHAGEGIYTVSYGSSKYEAISENSNYKKGTNVYVQIPQGDWNEQKIIVSQKAVKDSTPIIYNNPFNDFADITANLISVEQIKYSGLIANDPGYNFAGIIRDEIPIGYLVPEVEPNDSDLEILGYERLGSINGTGLTDFTRLGISAEFKSMLATYQTTAGDYGLRVDITFEARSGTAEKEIHLYLNAEDMVGNPYQFSGFTKQEKLFNIGAFTECSKIKKVILTFYQKNGSFKDKYGYPIEYESGAPVNPNLFIQNIYIALGYDVEVYEGEKIKIFTDNTNTYKYIAENTTPAEGGTEASAQPEENHKEVNISWIHDFGNKYREVTRDNTISNTLTWYRKKPGAKAPSAVVGEDWEVLSIQSTKVNDASGVITHEHKIKDQDIIDYNNKAGNAGRYPSFNKTWLIPNPKNKEEQVKAVVEYGDNKVLTSNTLTFENIGQIITNAQRHQIAALSIRCMDDSSGVYLKYKKNGEIIDSYESTKEREMCLYFAPYNEETDEIGEPVELLEAEYVEWIIPKNSMISLKGQNGIDADVYIHPLAIYSDSQFSVSESDNCYHIISYSLGCFSSIPYCIKNRLNMDSYGNNQIRVKIIKNGYEYSANLDMTFAVAGTSGTDYTFYIDFIDEKKKALTYDSSKDLRGAEPIKVRATLYDYNGKDITNQYASNIEWKWKYDKWDDSIPSPIEIIKPTNGREATLKLRDGIIEKDIFKNYNILTASISNMFNFDNGQKAIQLNAYLPIPIRLEYGYNISGTTTVRYNSLGTLDDLSYYQNPYQIFNLEGNSVEGITWRFATKEENSEIYRNDSSDTETAIEVLGLAKIKEAVFEADTEKEYHQYYFNPSNIYSMVEENESIGTHFYDKIVVLGFKDEKIYWSQPIYIYQNKYASSTLDSWNGELTIDEKNNTIMAAKIAAGTKSVVDNTFTGVIMGDWKEKYIDSSNASNETWLNNSGLYGFKSGVSTFGFNTEGKAYIGAPGHGRIIVDGDSGQIKSADYIDKPEEKGMCIDLDDGFIEMKNGDNLIRIDSDANSDPLRIGTYDPSKDPNFKVAWDGTLFATGAVFTGGSLIAQDTEGRRHLSLNPSDTSYPFKIGTKNDENFKVSWDGILEATGATFTDGDIIINQGDNNPVISLSSKADEYPFTIGYKFKVAWDGTLDASGAKFTNGSVILNNGSSKITLDSDLSTYPFTIGDNFKVSWDGNLEGRKAMFEESSIQGEYGKIGSLTGTRILIDEGSCFLNQFSPNMNTNRIFIHKKFEIKYLLQYYKDGKWNPLHEAIENGYQLNEDLMFSAGSGNDVDINSLEEKLKELNDELEVLNEQLAKDKADFETDPEVIQLQEKLKQLEEQLAALEAAGGDTRGIERNISSTKIAISSIRKDYLEATTDEIKLKKEAIANMERRIQSAQSQNDATFDKETSIFTDIYDYSYKLNKDTNSIESEFNEGNLPSLQEYSLIEITEGDEEKVYSETLAWFLNSIEAKEDDSRGLIGLLPGKEEVWVDTNGDGSGDLKTYKATHNLGILATSEDANIVIEGENRIEKDENGQDKNVGHSIRIGNQEESDKLWMTITPENQHGIYARFA